MNEAGTIVFIQDENGEWKEANKEDRITTRIAAYFRFDRVNGLEPVIELEELKDKFTILFQIVDKDFKNRGWMKRFYFSNRQELLAIEAKIKDYLGKIEEA